MYVMKHYLVVLYHDLPNYTKEQAPLCGVIKIVCLPSTAFSVLFWCETNFITVVLGGDCEIEISELTDILKSTKNICEYMPK